MRSIKILVLLMVSLNVYANVIPVGTDNNKLYYKIGGGSNFALPPVSNSETIHLNTNTNLGMGYSCGAYNPALSITNSLNNLTSAGQNLPGEVMTNATAAIITMPEYELAKRNPSLYALLNGKILQADQKVAISTKDCGAVKDQIARGNDQWQKKLSLTAEGQEDINNARKDIEAHSGDDGVTWVAGKSDSNGNLHAGGTGGQPPIHVIADTVKAGYNTLLNRNLQSDQPAPSSELANSFPTPQSAMDWVTSVIGDQLITTCNDNECKQKQGSVVGKGLLPWVTNCQNNNDNCVDTIKDHLSKLVTGNEAVNKENLERVSAEGIAMSPEAISAIAKMDTTQKTIIVNKLAQEISMQRVIDKAFLARNLLATGAQVPIIAGNKPAQVAINKGLNTFDNDIRSLTFESDVRKKMVSNTLSEVLDYSNQQQKNAMNVSPASSNQNLMDNGAMSTQEKK
jgi:integrating conjugative element protein (TIGR03755 family)